MFQILNNSIKLKSSKNIYRKVKHSVFDKILLKKIDIYYIEKKTNFFDWSKVSRDFYTEKEVDSYHDSLVQYNEDSKLVITYYK